MTDTRSRKPSALSAPAALATQAISAEVLLEKYAKGDERSADDIHRRVARALAAGRGAGAARARGRRASSRRSSAASSPPGASSRRPARALSRDADQLLRAAGRRLDRAGRRRPPRHLHRADRSGRDDAPRRRRRLRLLAHPTARRVGRQHAESNASGPVSYMRVFDRSCETVESAGSRRGAQMGVLRCDHPDIEEFIHAKDRGDLKNFNISVGVTDALHAAPCATAATSSWCTAPSPAPAQKAAAPTSAPTGMWVYRNLPARDAVGADHAVDLRPRRAGRAVPRPHQRRQQPRLLRDHREHQPVRRTAAAGLRLLLPRLDRPDALRARAVRGGCALRRRCASPRWCASRCACSTTCST